MTRRASLCRKCRDTLSHGILHGCWRGGVTTDPEGYVWEWCPDDPRAKNGRYMRQHVLVMERHLGRKLRRGEFVHHINGIRSDNRIENLELWVRSHPSGQRVSDLLAWAREIVSRYSDEETLLAT